MTLDKGSRDAIARAVTQLRALFEAEFSQLASGRFGLHAERRAGVEERAPKNLVTPEEQREGELLPWVEPLDALSLTPGQIIQREELVGAVSYLHHEGLEGGQAVARLVREAAFTAVNRLLAVRVAEAIGVLPEATSSGRQSRGYREVVRDLFPLLGQDADEGFWLYLQVCGDELGASVPLLFDRRRPTSAFVPSRACIDSALLLISDKSVAHLWGEPEALGWAYQFFNTEVERKDMRASRAPRNAHELAVRNQFFTPRYVVEWLVQNTLGRRLRQAGYEVDLPLLLGEVGHSVPLELNEVRVLDPAVGSGHFLLGCYDLLERAWASIGIGPEAAAPRILPCLFGVEIDPRASQVAQAVLLLRARRSGQNAVLEPPRIVTARGLPGDPEVRSEVFTRLSENARDLASELEEALVEAPLLGPLLKVEARLQAALKRALAVPKLANDVTFERLEQELYGALHEIAGRSDATAAERMFAAEAADAIRFVEICTHRYDAVLMNPPFGRPVTSTRNYLETVYGSSSVDMYAAFVDRGVDLLNDRGFLGAVTSRTGFFQSTYEGWRREVLLPRVRSIVDLGMGVMHDAMVEAAAYVLDRSPGRDEIEIIRCTDTLDKAEAIAAGGGHRFIIRRAGLSALPGATLAYWAPPEFLELYGKFPLAEGRAGSARQGLITADDFRFVRLWWEVSEHSRAPQPVGKWCPYPKGGTYSPFYVHIPTVVLWANDGSELRESQRARVQNTDYFLRSGVTWTLRTHAFSPQVLPRGTIISMRSLGLFPDQEDDVLAVLGWSSATQVDLLAKLLLGRVGHPEFKIGVVQQLPWPGANALLAELARLGWEFVRKHWERDETSLDFVGPYALSGDDPRDQILGELRDLQERIDEAVDDLYGIQFHVKDEDRLGKTRFELPAVRPERWISFFLGVSFGRWRPSMTVATNGRRESPLQELPVRPPSSPAPSEILGGGEPRRILVDEAGHLDDVVTAIEAVASTHDEGEEILKASLDALGSKSLRGVLRNHFFERHLRHYSQGSRVAPIYWYLGVPSRSWGIWIYAPSLSREVLFAIEQTAREKLRRLNQQLALVRESRGEKADRAMLQRIEEMETLSAEIDIFADRAAVVAQSGWDPDFNDGLVLCAVPLEELFVDTAWKGEVAKHRAALETGEYLWATVQPTYFDSKR